MSVYSYPESDIVDRVTFKAMANGSMRAYLHASKNAKPETLRDVTEALQARDWQCIPFTLDGQPTLEVRGFRNEVQMLKELNGRHSIPGKGSHILDTEDAGFTRKLKKRSLQASGAFYSIGDINFFQYGLKEGRWEDMLAGITYAAGTATLLGYGRNDQSDKEIKELSTHIAEALAKENIKLPDDCAFGKILKEKKRNPVETAHMLLKHYPAEIFNLFTGLAGACIAVSALRYKVLKKSAAAGGHEQAIFKSPAELKRFRTAGWLDVGLGAITMASTAIGGLVEEKAHDPDEPRKHGLQGMVEWVRERPLTVAGIGLMASTGLHAISSGIEYFQCKRLGHDERLAAIRNRAWFVFSNLAAEALVAISSKGHGEGVVSDRSVDDSVIALAADMIVRQPPAQHEHLINYMAPFLGAPNVLAMKDDEVKDLLRKQVEYSRQNPWACENPASIIASQDKAAVPVWQAKLAAETPASPHV